MNTGRYICYHIFRKCTVSLPSVSTSLRILAVNEEAFLTLVTVSASLNVIYNHTVSFFKVQHVFSNLYNLSARLMTCNHIVISCSTCLICMFIIMIFQITSAKTGCLHVQKYLSRSGYRHRLLYLLYFCSSRKFHTDHLFWNFVFHVVFLLNIFMIFLLLIFLVYSFCHPHLTPFSHSIT